MERSGNPAVDALIESFLRERLGDWTSDDDTIESLRDGGRAHGACDAVSEQFVAFAKDRGFKAYVTPTDLGELGYEIQGEARGEVLNAEGEVKIGHYEEHAVASIYLAGQAFPIIIDFTASQYGYTEHPKVAV